MDHTFGASQVALMVKNPSVMQDSQEMWVWSLSQEDPWRRAWQPSLVFLPRESHGQRSLAGYHPWGHKELAMTEVTYTCTHGSHFSSTA